MLGLPFNSAITVIAIAGLLLVATLVVWGFNRLHPEKDYTELNQRMRSWYVIALLVLGSFYLGHTATLLLFGFISYLALKEFLSIVPTRSSDRNIIIWAYLAIPVQYALIHIQWYGLFIIFIPVYLFLFLPIRMVIQGNTQGFIRSAGVLHWASMLSIFSISHLAYLSVLDSKNPEAGSLGMVLFVVLLTQLNDVLQYVFGKLLGEHKIIPKVSPNKTWEGFVGALISIAILAYYLSPFLLPISAWTGTLLGLLISVMGFFGDVTISAVKRDLAIKDSGHLLPGHGGILDRIDSLLFTAPFSFHFIYYVAY